MTQRCLSGMQERMTWPNHWDLFFQTGIDITLFHGQADKTQKEDFLLYCFWGHAPKK